MARWLAARDVVAAERVVRDRMGDAARLSVPLDVQIGRGADLDDLGTGVVVYHVRTAGEVDSQLPMLRRELQALGAGILAVLVL